MACVLGDSPRWSGSHRESQTPGRTFQKLAFIKQNKQTKGNWRNKLNKGEGSVKNEEQKQTKKNSLIFSER